MSRMKARRIAKKSAVSRECTLPIASDFESKAEFKMAKQAYKDCKWSAKKKAKANPSAYLTSYKTNPATINLSKKTL